MVINLLKTLKFENRAAFLIQWYHEIRCVSLHVKVNAKDNVYFRSATLEDLPILLDFEQGVIQAERPFNKGLKPDPINYYDLKALIESDQTNVIVAEIGKEIIASGYIRIEKAKPHLKYSHFAYLGFMYVKPEYRGKGLNKKLIEEMKAWAKLRNVCELHLEVYNDNLPAVRAYEKAGFEKLLITMRLGI